MSLRTLSTLSVDKIIENITNTDFVIPNFQRKYVWKKKDIIKLLDSIIKNIPIGNLLVWNTKSNVSIREFNGISIDDAVHHKYIIDGQQRVTSMFLAKYGKNEGEDIFVNLANLETFYYNKDNDSDNVFNGYIFTTANKKEYNDNDRLVRFSDIFDVSFRKNSNNFNATDIINMNNLLTDFNKYQLHIEEIDTKPSHIIDIFNRVNTTGIKLNVFDLVTAKCIGLFDLDKFHNSVVNDINDITDFGDLLSKGNSCDIIKVMIDIHNVKDVSRGGILKINAQLLSDNRDKIRQSLLDTTNYLINNGIKNKKEINNKQLFIAIANYFYHSEYTSKMLLNPKSFFDYPINSVNKV